jgi:hypothetical protein
MNKLEAIEKIKKCLALSSSSNEHEAAAALRQARKLMEQHQLTDHDIDAARADECKAKSGVTSQPPAWESNLAAYVGEAFGCRVIFCEGWCARRADWSFVGCGLSAEVAQYAFTVLLRQVKRARTEYIKAFLKRCKVATKTRRADIFCTGWVRAVAGKITAFARSDDDTSAINAYTACNYPELKKLDVKDRNSGKPLHGRSLGDYFAGRIQGENAQLNRGVTGAAGTALLGAS